MHAGTLPSGWIVAGNAADAATILLSTVALHGQDRLRSRGESWEQQSGQRRHAAPDITMWAAGALSGLQLLLWGLALEAVMRHNHQSLVRVFVTGRQFTQRP